MFDFIQIISKKRDIRLNHNTKHDQYLVGKDYHTKLIKGKNFSGEFYSFEAKDHEHYSNSEGINVFLIGSVFTNDNYYYEYHEQIKLNAALILKLYQKHGHNLVKYLKGIFVIFIADEDNLKYYSFVSRSGLYRLYYCHQPDRLIISTSVSSIIANLSTIPSLDESALIQQYIFDHTLGSKTHFKSIELQDNYTYLIYDLQDLEAVKYFSLATAFLQDRKLSWVEAYDQIADKFNSVMDLIVPVTQINSSLTGGYDSRTILSYLLTRKNIDFQLYSWATDQRWHDVEIPRNITDRLGLKYLQIDLGEEMLDSYDYFADQQIYWTDGTGSISRCNQMYSHSILTRYSRNLLTGYFGSEIFKPLHTSNVMIKELFVRFLTIREREKLLEDIFSDLKQKAVFHNDFLAENKHDFFDLTLEYFKSLDILEKNSDKLFHYLLKTGFWKFFGQEFHAQRINTFMISPYFDDDFVDFIINSEIMNVHNHYYRRNISISLKSQSIYNPIIKKNAPELMKFIINRGFKPDDYYSLTYPFNIIYKYYTNRIKQKRSKVIGFCSREWNKISYQKHAELFKSNDYMNEINIDKIPHPELSKIYSIRRWLNFFGY